MRDIMSGGDLILELCRRLELDSGTAALIFIGTPTNFPVFFRDRLPLFAHRSGAVGITLFGRVYFCQLLTATYSPEELMVLLRHEAEHVRQQRGDPFFHPRYVLGWLRRFIPLCLEGKLSGESSWLRRCADQAYRDLPAEIEAYAAENRARATIMEIIRDRHAESGVPVKK